MAISCAKKEEGSGYIGPSDIRIEDGVMTPDLVNLSTLPNKRGVNSEEFLDAIAARLQEG